MKTRLCILVAGISLATLWTGLGQPIITTQPKDFPSASLRASVSTRVTATGTTPLSYQWRFNGVPIPGKTTYFITLTNVQLADAGNYDVVVTNVGGSITSQVATLTVDPTFTKITTGVIVTDAEGSVSGSWADYDNDNYPDLFVCNTSSGGTTHSALYHNERGTNFSRVATGPVATDLMSVWLSAWADYDNDGNVDLIAANLNGGTLAQRLYRTTGNGTFTAVADLALRSDTTVASSPWWLDFDNDGFVDLFVAKGFPGSLVNDCLFRNNGDGTFTKMRASEVGSILNDQMGSESCHSVDYDNDGRQELMVYYNLSTGYTNVTWRWEGPGGFATTTNGMPLGAVGWGDYNNDGWLDACGTALCAPQVLFRNLGASGGGFADATEALTMSTPIAPASPAWGDYDNDGWLDLFFTSLYAFATNTVNGMFHNNRDGTFTQILTGSPVYDGDNRWAPAWADYDNDGFLDLFIAVGDGLPQRNRLYRNNGNANHWLKVKLDGRASNRSGIGARVRAQATINGQTFWQVREISCGVGQGGQSCLLAHFGLGDATNVTTLQITWPSGIVQEIQNVTADQFLTVEEHQVYAGPSPVFAGVTTTTNGLQLSIVEPVAGAVYALEGSTNLVNWTKLLARTSAGGTFAYTDTRMTNYTGRFYRVVVP